MTDKGLTRYKEYVDSNVEWLGEIPAHWTVTRNKDIFEERGSLMCQHFSGHKITQLFAEFRILLETNSHWQNGFSLGYKTPQYIQI